MEFELRLCDLRADGAGMNVAGLGQERRKPWGLQGFFIRGLGLGLCKVPEISRGPAIFFDEGERNHGHSVPSSLKCCPFSASSVGTTGDTPGPSSRLFCKRLAPISWLV
jgi:hypothetical protein